MKTIPLTQGKVAIVDDDDYEYLSQWKWQAVLSRGGKWYARRKETLPTGARMISMHGVLCPCKPGEEVDHRDGDSLNNQKENLRSVSHSVNMFNMNRRPGKSGIRGVYRFPNGRWFATIQRNKENHYLGGFDNLEDAKEARRLAEIKYFGEVYIPKI